MYSYITRLEHRRLTPDAPNLAEGVTHLAHRHVGASRVEDRRHQIPVVAGRILLQTGESGLDCPRVTPATQRLHALDLLALERRVDLEDRDLLLVVEAITVDAD